ncbi:universal stress protein [Robiginitalea sp. SC105]|uniref:universal stress protein n=1 Tax=Robiginitalea sp. SC105 TaxID=2762332 RepID=UPI0016396A66|nr:universal stress protein [Robiginitalea sp. SC105]MBC2839559.1 universal stress protein [Robiginitalea sp. SC105]
MKSILYATDYSEASVAALHCAQVLSRNLDLRLVLCHVYDVPTLLGTQLEGPFPHLRTDAYTTQRKKLKAFFEKNREDNHPVRELHVEPVENMSVLSGILSKASEWQTRLIVVGMKGESLVRGMIMGSTTKKLVDKAPCPVLAVPAKHHFTEIKNLVYATDFEVEDIKALEKVVILARAFGAAVHVVHVTEDTQYSGPSNLSWFRQMLESQVKYENLHFELLKSGDVANSLKDYTEHQEASLIGMLERSSKHNTNKWFRRDLVKQMASNKSIPLLSFNEQNLKTLFV